MAIIGPILQYGHIILLHPIHTLHIYDVEDIDNGRMIIDSYSPLASTGYNTYEKRRRFQDRIRVP
jgi:hypothetical protein